MKWDLNPCAFAVELETTTLTTRSFMQTSTNSRCLRGLIPIPGVEPGPRDGKSPILTARLYRIVVLNKNYNLIFWLY